MKQKKLIISAFAAGAVFLSMGYPFFKLLIDGKKGKKSGGSKWKHLKHAKLNHPRNGFEDKYEAGKAWCMEQPMEDLFLTSRDGLRLHASYLRAKEPKRIVLLSHGYRGSGFGDFANTARFLHENGCDLLFLDQRCCGKSEGRYITFGAKEQWDILDWTYRLEEKNSSALPIFLFGESMGASAVLMASGHGLPGSVKGLICDCGFSSMKRALRYVAGEWLHLDFIELLLLRVDLFCRILADFKMADADTKKALAVNKIPVLFFHGSRDTFVNPKNANRNYELCRAKKELVIIDGARHLCSAYVGEERYRKKLLEFFSSEESV